MPHIHQNGKPTIGVLAGWQFYRTATNLSYLAPVFRGTIKAAQVLGCNLLLGCGMGPSASPTDPLRPAWPVTTPDQDFVPVGPWNTDGLIIALPLHSPARSQYIQELIASGHPVLFVGSGEPGPTIVANNTAGILEALRHLVAHGHKQVAFIAGTREDMSGDSGERLRAYQSGCQAHGLEQNSGLVAYGRHVFDGGFAAMTQIIHSGLKFSAVLASNDESALGAMQALQESGLKIPQDVAVIGFDNRPEDNVQEPGLSSIHVPLFDIGYRAVDLMMQQISHNIQLPKIIQVDAHLVVRESCGCGIEKTPTSQTNVGRITITNERNKSSSELAESICTLILNQSHHLIESEVVSLCQQLVDTFISSRTGDNAPFQSALQEALKLTAAGEDDTHIWQSAISLLEKNISAESAIAIQEHELLNAARLTISAHMQRQHQRYVMNERWASSRLSLLTARLLTALEERQIYEILEKHLPELVIHTAWLGLFETYANNQATCTILRDALHPNRKPVRIQNQIFPPAELLPGQDQFILTLIPLVDQTGQLGFMTFGSEQFDMYGSIVQQVGGALNTMRLYRQATEARRVAEEANQMKSRFLSTISHELRTPLNLIVGLSGILLQESEEGTSSLPETAQKDIERIHAYGQHLGGLIGDVIDLASNDAGQLRLNNEHIDLSKTLQMVAESGSQLAADKGLGWHARIPSNGPWVFGDRTRLRQVVLNLINNAIKFTSQGEVRLWVKTGNQDVSITVQDTGLGIPPKEQSIIFDEFQRSERSIERGYQGLGLGLAICKRLVELHHGTMHLNSSGVEGEGSTFTITLPIEMPPQSKIIQPAVTSTVERSIQVFFSHIGTSDHLCTRLRAQGLLVQAAPMKHLPMMQSALTITPPGVFILDVSIESELGWKTLKTIKSHQALRKIPVMLYNLSQNGESLLNLDYLTKPIELAELTQALDQFGLIVDQDHPLRTFLVVDDETDTLDLHARVIRMQSAFNRVLKAKNGREALDFLKRESIDLVLLDLQMPEMDGFGVLAAMRENVRTREIPVIVITGKALTETDITRLNQSVAVVLKKGLFSMDETLAHITTVLERKRKLGIDTQRLVRQAMLFIQDNFSEAISRQEIARHVNIAEDYLTFCFRQELGTTPIKYLQRCRINQARLLLKNSSKSITQIALEVGFPDSSYFSRIFHRETGLSPESYRLT